MALEQRRHPDVNSGSDKRLRDLPRLAAEFRLNIHNEQNGVNLLELIRTFDVSTSPNPKQVLLEREWLLTNGLGGYSSGTLAGALTRRYHALLIAALGAPYGRTVLLNHIAEKVFTNKSVGYNLDTEQPDEKNIIVHGEKHLINFSLEMGLPVWRYKINDILLEKRLLMPHLQNTIYINYSVVECNSQCTLNLRPSIQFRHYDLPLTKNKNHQYCLTAKQKSFEITTDTGYPFLRLYLSGEKTQFVLDGENYIDTYHFVEADRGYESNGLLWTPGFIVSELKQGESITIIGSCESWDTICAIPFDDALSIEKSRRHRLIGSAVKEAQSGLAQELVIAADQFIITPIGRIADAARAHAEGDEVRSIIAGYHWFTDWGRDTMISLEGLTLVTGRHTEAGWILRTFAHYINNGLIPNLFPDGKNEGLYHTADATLWFFHALERYIYYTNDRKTLKLLLNKLINIIEHHITGTYFGIKADESDKLLVQGQNGYQLTWMDAKVSEWVVTPRKGKAVEINALWYNAIKLLAKWVTEERGISNAQYLNDLAETISISFNKRFWYAQGNYLYDVVDTQSGDDSSFRPNQIFSISLDNPVLKPEKWKVILDAVTERLLTPVGLRSLSREHPDYKEKYFGDIRSRDAAYHQGTVWGWLIGPFIDAWLKVHPDEFGTASALLNGFDSHIEEAGIGTISEIFDAEKPFTPRGCISQAWSVAEILRCLVKCKRRSEISE